MPEENAEEITPQMRMRMMQMQAQDEAYQRIRIVCGFVCRIEDISEGGPTCISFHLYRN